MNTATPKTIEDLSKPAAAAAAADIIKYHAMTDDLLAAQKRISDIEADLKKADALNDAKAIENEDLRAEMKKLKLNADVAVGKRAELEAVLATTRAQLAGIMGQITDFIGEAQPKPQNGQDRAAELGRSLDVH